MNIEEARTEFAGVENWLNQFNALQQQQPAYVARFQFLGGFIAGIEAQEADVSVEAPKVAPTKRTTPKKRARPVPAHD